MTFNLAAQASALLEAPNQGSLTEGWVSLSLPGGVAGYAVLRQSMPGIPDQETVVPLSGASSTSSVLPFDDTNYTTEVAVANTSSLPVTVAVSALDNTGAIIGTTTIALTPFAKTEQALSSLQGLSGVTGNRGSAYLTVTSGSIAALGLRLNGAAFASIPTTDK
jgi:hypothetical protein